MASVDSLVAATAVRHERKMASHVCSRCRAASMRTTYFSKECQVRHWKGPGGHKHGFGLTEEDRLIQKFKIMRDELTRLSDVQDSDAILAMAHEALECAQSQIVLSASLETSMAIFSYMGGAFQRKSLYTRAIEMNKQFIALSQAAGDLEWEGVAMCNLGEVYCSIGEYGQALALFERSNIIARRVGDVEGQHVVSKCLGTCCYALAEYEQSLIFFEAMPGGFNVQERAMCHHHLGHHERREGLTNLLESTTNAVKPSRKYHSVSTSLPISTGPNAIGDKVCSVLQLGVVLLY